MYTFVLVHGAWHYGELWEPVREQLEAAGHSVHTPTAGGLTLDGPHDVSHEQAWRPIADYIIARNLTDIVLVGHSWAGYLISTVAQEMPERMRRLVYFNAFVPAHGRAIVDEVPPEMVALMRASVEERRDGTVVLPFPVWRDAFIGDATVEFAMQIYDKLRPQPFRPLTEPADMSRWHTVTAPKSYLNTLEDNDLPQGRWARHPRLSDRLGVFRLIQMHGSHEVLLTNPELFAEKLVEAGRD